METPKADRITGQIETIFQRQYEVLAPDMRRLYENAKRDQWNASVDINWKAGGNVEQGIFANELIDIYGTPFWERMDERNQRQLNFEFSCWRISQLMHGEAGAMLTCAQLVDLVPTNDAKFFMSTQVVDEARHAEVLSRYMLDKCGGRVYPASSNIRKLFEFLLGNGKWFIKTVGLQLLAETFAVSLFRMLAETAIDPLLREICKRILSDESRHMGFSVLSLPDEIKGLSAGDLHELEDFIREAIGMVMGGQFPQGAYEAVGFNSSEIEEIRHVRKERAMGSEQAYFRRLFRREIHQQVVGNMRKVGLITPRTSSFLREMGMDPESKIAA